MKKKALWIIAITLVIAGGAFALLLQSAGPTSVQIKRTNDMPTVAYRKVEKQEPGNREFSLNICEPGMTPQRIVENVEDFRVSPDGTVIAFTLDNDQPRYELYRMESDGTIHMVTSDVIYDDFQFFNGDMIAYHDNGDTIYFPTDSGVKKITGAESYRWQVSADGSTVVYANTYDHYPDTAYNWGEIKAFRNGVTENIAEYAFMPGSQGISNDGQVIIYVIDYHVDNMDGEPYTGKLYLKRSGEEPILITDTSSMDIELSDDGNFVAAIVSDENGEDALLYQYCDGSATTIEGVSEFMMSSDGSTIIYTVDAAGDWDYELYSVKAGEVPILLTEHVSLAGAVSDDGNTIAYFTNLNTDGWLADLNLIQGAKEEFVDSQVCAPKYGGSLYVSHDGSLIAYLKNYNIDILGGDLYAFQMGKDPQKIDENVHEVISFFE